MSGKRKGEYVGVLGALLVHVAIIALLILVSFTVPNNQDEGGVPVMMGDVEHQVALWGKVILEG